LISKRRRGREWGARFSLSTKSSRANLTKVLKVMSKERKKIALESESHLHLLVSLFKMEEMLMKEKYEKLGKAFEELIEEVRYSEVIEEYTIIE